MTRVLLLIALLVALLASCGGPAPVVSTPPGTISLQPSSCHALGVPPDVLPDKVCTPGVVDPAVTQANIATTICKRGWTATVRPPVSYTEPIKLRSMKAYGYIDSPRLHELDHLVSLELGGAPRDPANLWAEPGASPNAKDRIENDLNHAVCSHRITLAAAQQAIAANWTTAEKTVGIAA